jgi:hypothetical protein
MSHALINLDSESRKFLLENLSILFLEAPTLEDRNVQIDTHLIECRFSRPLSIGLLFSELCRQL